MGVLIKQYSQLLNLIMLYLLRYGWISNGTIIILRYMIHENCAKNKTGVFPHSVKGLEELYDAYCYDENGKFLFIK